MEQRVNVPLSPAVRAEGKDCPDALEFGDDGPSLDLKDAFLQRVARWLRLEDALEEEMPD